MENKGDITFSSKLVQNKGKRGKVEYAMDEYGIAIFK